MNSDCASCEDSDSEVSYTNPSSKKRKMTEMESCLSNNNDIIFGRHFVPVRNSCHVYQTEDWKPSGTALFTPLTEDLLINVNKLDQISCIEGNYFIADQSGKYSETVLGKVLHLWRYDKQGRQLYISRSLLFTNYQKCNEHYKQISETLQSSVHHGIFSCSASSTKNLNHVICVNGISLMRLLPVLRVPHPMDTK